MAFPVEQSTNTTIQTSNATSWGAQNMPSGIVAGDTLCAFVAVDGGNQTVTFTGGWSKLLDGAAGSDGSVTLAVAYKKAVGSDTLSLTIGSTQQGACRVVRVDMAEDPDTQAPEIGIVTTGVSATPTVDAITPTGGSKDYKFYSLCAHDRNRSFTSAPTNYQDNERTLVSGGANGAQISDGDRDLNASVENPGNFTYAQQDGFATVVLAIHPILANISIAVPVGSLTATGQAPVLDTGVQVPPGTLSLTGFAPTVQGGITIAVPVGSLTLTGFAPTVEISHVAVPATGTLALTGLAATVGITHVRDPPVGSLALTGFVPSVDITKSVPVPVGSGVFTGFAPTVIQTFSIDVPVGLGTFTGFAPTVVQTFSIDVPVGSLVVTGFVPTFDITQAIPVPTGSLTITGQAPTLIQLFNFDIPVGALSLTGQTPTVSIFVEPPLTEDIFPRFQKVTLVRDFFSVITNLLTEAEGKLLKEDGGGLLSRDDTIVPVYATTVVANQPFEVNRNLLTEVGGRLLQEDGGALLSNSNTVFPIYGLTVISGDFFTSVRMPR